MTNEAFFSKHAGEAMIGLVGGTHFIDEGIKKAQRKITANKANSPFSHAFIIGEKRRDGKRWIIESDLAFHKKQMILGVQENRIDKYFDEKAYPNLAILDFSLSNKHSDLILKEALELVADRATYSMREIFGIALSFAKSDKRERENTFSKENSFVCSTFVQHLYLKAGIQFSDKVSSKHIAPDDIYNTAISCKKETLIRKK